MQIKILAACCTCFLVSALSFGQPETVAKPMSQREKNKRERSLRDELQSQYAIWEKVDVAYIITDAERAAFHRLSNDEERAKFVEQFWLRRDPTPDTEENEYKEEHYRRIAFANEHFASGVPGWRTDRGEIYIKYGPPDEIKSHPSGETYQRTIEEGGGQTSTYPFEQWRYRYLEGIGSDVVIEFVDQTMTGEYRMIANPSAKDALLHVPGNQPLIGNGTAAPDFGSNVFDRLERDADLRKPPPLKFADLEAAVTSNIRYDALSMKVQADFIPITPASIRTNITLQFNRKDLQFQQRNGSARAVVNLYGRITDIAWHPVSTFTDVVSADVAPQLLAEALFGSSIYQKTVPLAPGKYRLNVIAKDVIGGNMGTYETTLDVPQLEEDQLGASSLILADILERLPSSDAGAGQFAIGGMKVRPRPDEAFRSDESLGIYMQLYHFAPDPATHKPDGSIEYQVVKNGSNETLLSYMEPADSLPGSTSELIMAKLLPLQELSPGSYNLQLRVTDNNRKQSITSSATFTVLP